MGLRKRSKDIFSKTLPYSSFFKGRFHLTQIHKPVIICQSPFDERKKNLINLDCELELDSLHHSLWSWDANRLWVFPFLLLLCSAPPSCTASHVRPQCLTMDFLFLPCTYEVSSTISTGTRTSDGIHIWKNCNLFQKSRGQFFFSFCRLGFETRLGPRLGHMSRLFYEFLCNEKYIKQWHFVQYFTRRNNLLNGKVV